MELYVNGEKLDVTLENEKTVGEVLRSFEITCEENHMATIGIVLNGTQISADDFDRAAAELLTDSTKIELTVETEQEIKDAFITLGQKFRSLAAAMEEIPSKLQTNKADDSKSSITSLADTVDDFCHTATMSALFPETYGNLKINGNPLHEFFADFAQILADFQKAFVEKDIVSIGDIAEYEICPRLSAIADAIDTVTGEQAS